MDGCDHLFIPNLSQVFQFLSYSST